MSFSAGRQPPRWPGAAPWSALCPVAPSRLPSRVPVPACVTGLPDIPGLASLSTQTKRLYVSVGIANRRKTDSKQALPRYFKTYANHQVFNAFRLLACHELSQRSCDSLEVWVRRLQKLPSTIKTVGSKSL